MLTVLQEVNGFFSGSSGFNLLTFVLALVGIVLTIYFYLKSKRSRNPTYLVRTVNLVKEGIKKIETVEIFFSGNRISNLSITKIALWNEGRETINNTDIAASNPLKLVVNDSYEILEAEVLLQKNTANDFRIEIEPNKKAVKILFDYFDYGEGIVIQVAHTGSSSDDIKISGTVKTVKKITRKNLSSTILPSFLYKSIPNKKNLSFRYTLGGGLIIIGTIFILLIVLPIIFPGEDFLGADVFFSAQVSEPPSATRRLILCLPAIIYIWMGFRAIKKNVPKGFDIFDEEF